MGFFKRLLRHQTPYAPPPAADGPVAPPPAPAREPVYAGVGRFYMDIVGESHYQPALKRAFRDAGQRSPEGRVIVPVIVMCEPTNAHDPNAVKVCIGRETIGYLSRERARKFRKAIAKVGGVVSCHAILVQGDAGVIGAWIDLCDPWAIPGVKEYKPAARKRAAKKTGDVRRSGSHEP